MDELDLNKLDLATLALLAGISANERLLAVARASGRTGLRNAHGYMFQHLLSGPKAIGELAERLGITQQAVSKTALELERMGYVAKHVDERDSRVRRIALTPHGHAAVERARAARADLEAELVAAVGARTVSAGRRALIALLEHTGGHEAVARRRVRPPSG